MQISEGRVKALVKIGEHPLDLFSFMARRLSGGERCALATLVKVSGTFSRKPGAHMVICENGDYAGAISSGCVDADIARQAFDAIQSQQTRTIQYGAGAPYIDVKLPCGAGIEILIAPKLDASSLDNIVALLTARTPVKLSMNVETGDLKASATQSFEGGWEENIFHIAHAPKIQIAAAGRGQELFYLTKLALAAGYDVICFSPDGDMLEVCARLGARVEVLKSTTAAPELPDDPWTAVVLLFHDHEWEPALLKAALAGDAFFIGALGSRKTQKARLEALHREGQDASTLHRIVGPVGLVPSTRDASALAVSTLAQILDADCKAGWR